MVLENRLNALFLLLCSLPLVACAETVTSDKAHVHNFTLQLSSTPSQCQLTFEGPSAGTLTLALSPPCHFNRYAGKNDLKVFAYDDVGAKAVVLILNNTKEREGCKGQAQGILIKEESLSLSSHMEQCIKHTDEIVYWDMAHPKP